MPSLHDHRALGAAIAALLVLQTVVVVSRSSGPPVPSVASPPVVADVTEPATSETPDHQHSPTAAPTPAPAPVDPQPPAAPPPVGPSTAGDPPSGSGGLRTITTDEDSTTEADPPPPQRGPAEPPTPGDPARARFEQRFPGHAAAQQDLDDPATTRWAVIIGINDHQGRVRDNVGSRQDAEEFAQHLIALGWQRDHVLLLTDATATYENLTQAIAWLARKTDGDSVAVFHYSGHTKKWYGQDADGDGEVTDEGLWPSDNRHIIDSEWVARMAAVDAGRLWIDIGGCESAGLNDPGLDRAGRIMTFSSTEQQKSYEDPSRANSVWGYYLVDQGLQARAGDLNGDGNVTVEEAFNYAAPRAAQRTEGQRYGAQQAVVVDRVDGDFDLRIPPPPREPEPEPTDGDDGDDGCTILCASAPSRERLAAQAGQRRLLRLNRSRGR